MSAATHTTPVVMLRSPHHGGLGIARSLGRMGVPVYAVEAARWEPAAVSRYCRGRFLLDVANTPPDQAVSMLRTIARQVGRRPILMPTTDRMCLWLAEHAGLLRSDFRFPEQDPDLVRTLCDKSRMQELAARSGVPIARSTLPASQRDIDRFLETASFPVMVKETGGGSLRRRAGAGKFIVRSAGELAELYARAGDPGHPDFLVQEWIPGEDWMFNGYFDGRSQCLFGMTGMKIRRFPAHTGVTSLGVCLANPQVLQTTCAFMRAIGYRGILDIGYRRDRRDGQYKVLDVNPRIGCTFRLFVGAGGLDVARALYLDLTGKAVPAAEAVDGRKWLVEDFDLFSALRTWREGTLSIREWLLSLSGVQEAACFALDDPLPFLMTPVADCCELLQWRRARRTTRLRGGQTAPALPLVSTKRS